MSRSTRDNRDKDILELCTTTNNNINFDDLKAQLKILGNIRVNFIN